MDLSGEFTGPQRGPFEPGESPLVVYPVQMSKRRIPDVFDRADCSISTANNASSSSPSLEDAVPNPKRPRLRQDASQPSDQDIINRRDLSSTTASLFHGASDTNITNSSFNNVGRDQYIINAETGPDQGRQAIAEWLSPLNFKPIHLQISEICEEGTGQWLLNCETFKDWRDGHSQILWCPGDPGAGKTILTSIIINHLESFFKGRDIAITYMYCNYKQQTEQTVCNLITGLLGKLVRDYPVVYEDVKHIYELHKKNGTRLTLDEALRVLVSAARRFSKVFIVLDALDECPEAPGTRAGLLAALRTLKDTFKLLVTSRDLSSVAEDFCDAQRLRISASNDDVRRYIEKRIDSERWLKRYVKKCPELQEEIVTKILENVQGMFLLARLHMNSLADTISPTHARQVLRHLPKEVNVIYNETLQRIDGQVEAKKVLARKAICWIVHAFRQLSLEELQHALAVEHGMLEMDPDSLVDESMLTSVCCGLVVIDEDTEVIRLVHYTAQEYFEQIRDSGFSRAHIDITETCITYLSFSVFDLDFEPDGSARKKFLKSHALFDYATRYWGRHARGYADAEAKALRFLESESNCFVNSITLLYSDWDPGWYWESYWEYYDGEEPSPMHISAFFGLEQTVRDQLRKGANVNAEYVCGTPLCLAAMNGHEAVVKLLLEQDPVYPVGEMDQKPLTLAAKGGHDRVVELLLARDEVDVNECDFDGRTPLAEAAMNGHEAVVKLLLEQDDVNVNSYESNDGFTPLSDAAFKGHEAVVKLLLARHDIDINFNPIDLGTSLYWAVYHQQEAVVKLLLAQDNVDVNLGGWDGRTPLSVAVGQGDETIAELLRAQNAIESPPEV